MVSVFHLLFYAKTVKCLLPDYGITFLSEQYGNFDVIETVKIWLIQTKLWTAGCEIRNNLAPIAIFINQSIRIKVQCILCTRDRNNAQRLFHTQTIKWPHVLRRKQTHLCNYEII